MNRRTSGVMTTVGATAFTRMPRAAYSTAAARVSATIPAFVNV